MLVGCWAALIVGLYPLMRLWRTDDLRVARAVEVVDLMSPFSRRVIRGIIRASPIVWFWASLAFIGITVQFVWGAKHGPKTWADTTGGILAVVDLLMFFLLVPMVIFFNRPRFLVPPTLRGDVGVAANWIRRIRNRKSSDDVLKLDL
jgi:hypothetical protein